MPDTVKTHDGQQDFLPLLFRGFIAPGKCFARVNIFNGKITLLCSQLPGYRGTSITNAVEAILDSLVAVLMHNAGTGTTPALEVVPGFPLLRMFVTSQEQRDIRDFHTARQYVLRNCYWIEHYPRGESLRADRESHAVITFNEAGSPAWTYQPRSAIEQQLPDPRFLDIPEGAASWQTM